MFQNLLTERQSSAGPKLAAWIRPTQEPWEGPELTPKRSWCGEDVPDREQPEAGPELAAQVGHLLQAPSWRHRSGAGLESWSVWTTSTTEILPRLTTQWISRVPVHQIP